jgi:CRP/FNR family transcriptional regulator, cyclic AMP receptor protein
VNTPPPAQESGRGRRRLYADASRHTARVPRSVADELAAVEFFAEVDAEALRALAGHAVTRRLAAGQMLFLAGDPSDHLVIVRDGRLRVLVSSERGDEFVLTVLTAGDVVGELALFDGESRSASVDALDPTTVLLLPAAHVRDVLANCPAALLAVIRQLTGEVRRLTGGAADLVFLDLARRLAKLIVSRSVRAPDGRSVADLGMSQTGLAVQLGTTRQSVNRALSSFVRRGWVIQEGTTIMVRDGAGLRRFSESA